MLWIEQLRSAPWGEVGSFVIASYLIGCFSTGYYLLRWRKGQDLRDLGSGSLGARNAGRVLGWLGFVLTLAGDFLKGSLAVWAAALWSNDSPLPALALLAVVAGHIWPVQLGFRGGKGVATSLGGLCVFDPHLATGFALVFAAVWLLGRKTVLCGLFAFASLPLVSSWLGRTSAESVTVAVLAGLVLIAHRKNIIDEISRWFEQRRIEPKESPPDL